MHSRAALKPVTKRASVSDVIPKPDGAELRPGKNRRVIPRVAVIDSLRRAHFAAQISVDPIGANTWTDLVGTGKTHKLIGYASGTVLWVHFAATFGHRRSDWCEAVRIVMP